MATKLEEFIVAQGAFERKACDFAACMVKEFNRNGNRDHIRKAIGSVLYRELEVLASLDGISTAAAEEWLHCEDFDEVK
ncbi:MAG: hypothetical protein MJY89_06370 [Bacteroidales bacterium]|nr:hypothetical protein [Bacteroidales bacterium]